MRKWHNLTRSRSARLRLWHGPVTLRARKLMQRPNRRPRRRARWCNSTCHQSRQRNHKLLHENPPSLNHVSIMWPRMTKPQLYTTCYSNLNPQKKTRTRGLQHTQNALHSSMEPWLRAIPTIGFSRPRSPRVTQDTWVLQKLPRDSRSHGSPSSYTARSHWRELSTCKGSFTNLMRLS